MEACDDSPLRRYPLSFEFQAFLREWVIEEESPLPTGSESRRKKESLPRGPHFVKKKPLSYSERLQTVSEKGRTNPYKRKDCPRMETIHIGMIGAGTVGSGVLKILREETRKIEKDFGLSIVLHSVCTRTPGKVLPILKEFPNTILTDDILKVAGNPEIDIILELIGGTTTSEEIVVRSLQAKQTVITANKALLSEKGDSLFKIAEENHSEIGYEAAVGGAIPVVRAIRTCLAGDRFLGLYGILNGTTNFILSKMEKENLNYAEALRLAQEKGFAEADPSFDVEGIDTAHKISILGSLAFGEKIPLQSITTEGITKITRLDIQFASDLGYRIKLLGLVRKLDGKIEARVQPVMIPVQHAFASVMNETNAVYYKTAYAGSGLLVGKGAGALPTASAVIADLIYYAFRRKKTSRWSEIGFIGPAFPKQTRRKPDIIYDLIQLINRAFWLKLLKFWEQTGFRYLPCVKTNPIRSLSKLWLSRILALRLRFWPLSEESIRWM